MNEYLDELVDDANKMRSLYHYYRKLVQRNDLDEARMIIAKEKLDLINAEIKKERYKEKVAIFLKDHPEMSSMFSEK